MRRLSSLQRRFTVKTTQYSKAKEYYEKALAIRKKIYGEKQGDVAAGYSNLGKVYSGLGQYNEPLIAMKRPASL